MGLSRDAGHPRRDQVPPAARRHRLRPREEPRLAGTKDARLDGRAVQVDERTQVGRLSQTAMIKSLYELLLSQ